MSSSEILDLFSKLSGNNELNIVQSFHLNAVENTHAMARTNSRDWDGNTQSAMVQLTFAKKNDQVLCDVEYQVSRMTVEDGSKPELVREIESTVFLKIGEPTLVGGFSGIDSTYLIVTFEG